MDRKTVHYHISRPQEYPVERLTKVLAFAQERAIRRIGRYGDTELDEDERLTGQAEDLEFRVASLLYHAMPDHYGEEVRIPWTK